jgi:hypothetical protein
VDTEIRHILITLQSELHLILNMEGAKDMYNKAPNFNEQKKQGKDTNRKQSGLDTNGDGNFDKKLDGENRPAT